MRNTLILSTLLAMSALAQATPGTLSHPIASADRDLDLVVISETGQITLSSDGLGMLGTSGLIQVDKPSDGATVRGAYLATASSGMSGFDIPNGCVTLAGVPINWDLATSSSIGSFNYWADVTGLLASVLNPMNAGIHDLEITECATDVIFGLAAIDGHALYVIFDDPATTITRTAIIEFGAQATTGDQFHIGFGQPVDVDASTVIELGLAIGFSYQHGACQSSWVDVNGLRLTSSAGGLDDGSLADAEQDWNGELVTVGGIGDSRLNPADPLFECDGSSFNTYDDELYNIAGYVSDGDTGVLVNTFNPSNDDNIFAAHILLDFAAVVGEGAVLTPAQAVNCLGEPHTVTVSLQDDNGQPVSGRDVVIDVVSGPNAGLGSGTLSTDGNGQASFTYTSLVEGLDVLLATFLNNAGAPEESNRATKLWERCDVGADETPAGFALAQNMPNPFNPTTTISFSLPETGHATLLVHTLAGELVRSQDLGVTSRGEHQVAFDGSNLASGVYLYTLQSEFGSQTRKMVLLK